MYCCLRNAASFKHLASTHAKVPPDVEQSKVSQFTVTHNNAALSSDAPGASRLDFTGLSLFDHFMCLWKHAHYTFANSAIQIAPRFNKGSEAPFPQLTLEKGLQFTANLCALWEAGYQQHISAKDVRVDVWNLLGGHQGVFTHPSASVLENLYAERNAVYSPLFSVEQSATGGSLDKTALPDKATLRETGLDATDYSLCVLSLFFAKLATTSNAEAVTLHLLNASALILLRCRFSPGTLFERIFPLLLKMMHSKPGVRVSRQALCLLTKLLVRCDPNAIPLGYIPVGYEEKQKHNAQVLLAHVLVIGLRLSASCGYRSTHVPTIPLIFARLSSFPFTSGVRDVFLVCFAFHYLFT